ncbi:DUF2267 domain-containing protein [Lyngbya sp. PCC 8106]|uniref:DUF2267 domain-containing protein n=1 Tax=Lyngbya sp. (strain PCC 8106) TaxID=313612 RepID=UPI0000EAA394|nr:DUF2267 domain-containing protein [Lyngbya sp. PCC 8106]EAW37792.1 hypothetical protein L8106_17552 [Lyngbya sp. PCC 8106]
METPQISQTNTAFLEKVKVKAGLNDLYEARDLSEIVFRTMRDLMTTESSDRVASELHEEAQPTDDKTLKSEISTLWKDTNPIVAWLSRVRPPLKFDDNTFIFRIEQEGGAPKGMSGETIIEAVFSATKHELSQSRIQEVSEFMPGKIKEIWQKA